MNNLFKTTPKNDGFWTRGEHEKHFGTIIMFPERRDIWRENAVYAQQLIIDLANVIINYEEVVFCVKPYLRNIVYKKLDSRIKIIEIDYDDIWARDIAPNFVVNNSEIRSICWNFNSWGGEIEGAYFPWDKDANFAKILSDKLGIKKYVVDDVVLEGGAVIADGKGTVYATKNVLLNKNRNPDLTIQQIEEKLHQYYCTEQIVWLEEGLALDETNGHIDNVCSIIRPGELCIAWTDDVNDPQYKVSRDAWRILKESATVKELYKMPLPKPMHIKSYEASGLELTTSSTHRVEGFQLVPSYINYYLFNSSLIFPMFDCEEDEIALKVINKVFPEREIIKFNAREPLIGGGGFHCILHEIPNIG